MRTPAPLKSGDTVAIIPTARAIAENELAEGLELLQAWGLKAKLGAGIGRKHFQLAGTDVQRAADLQDAIEDPDVRAIWCARGGYGTLRVLQLLDLSPLKKDPKWIIGFSDISVLHSALHNAGICSLHAQMPLAIGNKTEGTRGSLRNALFGKPDTIHYERSTDVKQIAGTAEGQLIGGNLSVLYSLRGTPYDIDPRGKVLVLEDLDELLYHVDRMVQNLKAGGWFKELAGLVVGGMTQMWNKNENDPFGMSAEEIILDAVGNATYPICFDFPAGHGTANEALVMGARVKLNVEDDTTTLRYV